MKKEKNNLTQAQLAEKIGISVNAVSKWERGLNLPDASIMLELCDLLDITVNELLSGEKLTPEEQKHKSDINAISIITTKNELENIKLLTEILIFAGIVVAMTLSRFFCYNTNSRNSNSYSRMVYLGIWIIYENQIKKKHQKKSLNNKFTE